MSQDDQRARWASQKCLEAMTENQSSEYQRGYEAGRAGLAFAGMIVGDSMDVGWGGFDGCDIEDAAIAAGLLTQVHVTGPCGEECGCAEIGEFPTECNRLTESGKLAISVAAAIRALPRQG